MRETTAATTSLVQARSDEGRRRDLLTGALIFVCTAIIFLVAHVHQIADAKYSLLLSQSLLHHHSFTLDAYHWPAQPTQTQVGYNSYGEFYQLEVNGGHIYYFFPPRRSLLFLPFFALFNPLGISAANTDGTYNQPRGTIMQTS